MTSSAGRCAEEKYSADIRVVRTCVLNATLLTTAPGAMPRVAKSVRKISQLVPIGAREHAILRIVAYVQVVANSVVFILSVQESVANTASLALSRVLGSVTTREVVLCHAERRATDFLAIYVVTVFSIVVINARRFAEKFVQTSTSVNNVAHQN